MSDESVTGRQSAYDDDEEAISIISGVLVEVATPKRARLTYRFPPGTDSTSIQTESASLFVGAPQCAGDLVVIRIQHETDQCGSADHRRSPDWDDVVPASLVRRREVKVKPGLI